MFDRDETSVHSSCKVLLLFEGGQVEFYIPTVGLDVKVHNILGTPLILQLTPHPSPHNLPYRYAKAQVGTNPLSQPNTYWTTDQMGTRRQKRQFPQITYRYTFELHLQLKLLSLKHLLVGIGHFGTQNDAQGVLHALSPSPLPPNCLKRTAVFFDEASIDKGNWYINDN